MTKQIAEGRLREQMEMFPDIPSVFFGPTADQIAKARDARDRLLDSMTRYTGDGKGIVTFEEVFQTIFDEAFDLLVERQKKYGPMNVEKLGLYGIFTRIEDKMERLRHAFNGQIVKGVFNVNETDESSDESLDDGDIDAANYHLIRVALRRGLWGRPLERDVVPHAD